MDQSNLKSAEEKEEMLRRNLRKRKTFKKGKDRNFLWRRRWIVIKTIESSFNALTWVRADNDLSNSESEFEQNGADLKTFSNKTSSFSFYRSARRRHSARLKASEDFNPEMPAAEMSQRTPAKSAKEGRVLPVGWVARKKFSKRSSVDKNMGKTEHACDVCKKVYGDFNSLKKHKRIHGEKKHMCAEKGCGKAFSEASKLKRHMMVHTGEKPFKCPYPTCRRDFGLNYNLRKHIQQIHTGELLACSHQGCSRMFMDQNAMKQHIKYYHQN